MPVSPQFVPLSTAKTWAKRLQRTSQTQTPDSPWPLSRCQLAVSQMLGFDHWHALTQVLSDTPAHVPERLPSPKEVLDFPDNQKGWDQFWAEVCNIEGITDIHIQHRPDFTQIQLRVNGALVVYAKGEMEKVIHAIGDLLMTVSSREHFLSDMGVSTTTALDLDGAFSYVNCKISIAGKAAQMQWLPVYPHGWDAVFFIGKG